MGFRVVDERTYQIQRNAQDAPEVWLHDMLLERADGGAVDIDALKQRLEACFLVVMTGGAENDGYNALVLGVGLMWRDVALIRTISRFLRQIRVPYSQDYMWATLVKHASIAAEIVRLFHARFDPRADRPRSTHGARGRDRGRRSRRRCKRSQSLDEDRILRHFVNAVQSAIRTNFYQIDTDGRPKPLIAIKFASRKLDGLPLPQPLYEIFVYSPRVEGVHMRFGKVARGGIRWSDRPQDFRTEVLGLVKAQQVKNAVIVPVGAKGGFVPKQLPGSRHRRRARGDAGRGHRDLQAVHLDPARPHRQSRHRQQASFRPTTSCAMTTTIPIWWSPPTRAPRRSPTSPTRSPPSIISGSATPSPPAARPATTTRRWASPRAAPGNR